MSLTITDLTSALSIERISVYQNYVRLQDDTLTSNEVNLKALDLYLWNVNMASALFEVINFYEVTLRNKVFNVIDIKFQDSIQDEKLKQALSGYMRAKLVKQISIPNITNALIVSRLNFSFWNCILDKMFYYSGKVDKQNNAVYPRLYKHNKMLFSIPKRVNKDVFNKLVGRLMAINSEVNDLRNRICHHEPIFKSKIRAIYIRMLFVLKYLDMNVYKTVKSMERVTSLLKQKPVG
ncbi:TPA: hypothetical protein ACU18W_002373 [Mannheimia haemolytica]